MACVSSNGNCWRAAGRPGLPGASAGARRGHGDTDTQVDGHWAHPNANCDAYDRTDANTEAHPNSSHANAQPDPDANSNDHTDGDADAHNNLNGHRHAYKHAGSNGNR